MSTIAIAVLVLLALAGAGRYLSFNGDLGTGPVIAHPPTKYVLILLLAALLGRRQVGILRQPKTIPADS